MLSETQIAAICTAEQVLVSAKHWEWRGKL